MTQGFGECGPAPFMCDVMSDCPNHQPYYRELNRQAWKREQERRRRMKEIKRGKREC